MFEKLQNTYNQFPRTYWVVVGTHFIDVIGNTLAVFRFLPCMSRKNLTSA